MTGHPLAEMADALDAAADRIDQAIEERAYVTPEVAADAERDSIRLRRTARVLRALHPDIARAALALADGLKVPDGWSVHMDDMGCLVVNGGGGFVAFFPDLDGWMSFVGSVPRGAGADIEAAEPFATAQAAVDAAIEALGGDPCP